MGHLISLRKPNAECEIFAPALARPDDQLKLVRIKDHANYNCALKRAVAACIIKGKELPEGFHSVYTPKGGPFIRYVERLPHNRIRLEAANPLHPDEFYDRSEVTIEGYVCYFLLDWQTGRRWELTEGTVRSDKDNAFDRPVLRVVEQPKL